MNEVNKLLVYLRKDTDNNIWQWEKAKRKRLTDKDISINVYRTRYYDTLIEIPTDVIDRWMYINTTESIDIDNWKNYEKLHNSVENSIKRSEDKAKDLIARKILSSVVRPAELPREPSPWLRGRNVLGVAFVGSAGLWVIFHNPGLIIIALGISFVVCLIKAAIDEN